MTTLTYTGSLTVISCWCGIRVGIPDDLYKAAKADPKQAVHCPLGHTFVYRESEATKLRRQLEATEAALTRSRAAADRARAEADHQAAVARGYKGALTKTKKRAAKGVCPAPGCKRSFVDVARHVATQHPDLCDSEATHG